MSLPPTEYFKFRITRDCKVVLAFYGPVTQEGIDMLQRTVELMQDCFPKAEEPKPFDLDSSCPSTEANGGVN